MVELKRKPGSGKFFKKRKKVTKKRVTKKPVENEVKKKSRDEIGYRDGGDGFAKWVEDFVCLPIYPEGSPIPVWTPVHSLPRSKHPETGRSYSDIWENQKVIMNDALQMVDGKFKHRLIVFIWPRGEGKCQRKGSEVLMYDGSIKKVEDVRVGDLLMGDDNTPREVLSLASGVDEMWEVIPYRGEKLVVTKDHILTLSEHERLIDIRLDEYLKLSPYKRETLKLKRVGVEFPERGVPIDPYWLGVWLGDGSAISTSVTTMDEEIKDYIVQYADDLGLKCSVRGKTGTDAETVSIVQERWIGVSANPLLTKLQELDLIENKHIPECYKVNSREVRLKVLAGIIDTDGYLNRKSYQIVQKSKRLTDDIVYLARSLGYGVTVKKSVKGIKSSGFTGEYYVIGITGPTIEIPVLLERKKAPRKKAPWKDWSISGIKEVRCIGEDEYYGFTLSGNGRYLTADFTITHNSLVACLIQLWKFFCFPRQQIMLGANSKDQVKFVHFDIMRDIILNSPKLLRIVGRKNVQEKEIRLRDKKGNIGSFIRSISSFSGIVSNVTGYTFSEMFDMKNPKFFVQLDGSIRNMPNALGVIDSTVSEKTHILYKLYQTYVRGKDPTLFVHYRYSGEGSFKDFWNPQMTQKQLDSYREKFPDVEFDRYFRNVWEAGSNKMFTPALVKATHYVGINGTLGCQNDVVKVLEKVEGRDKVGQRIHNEDYEDTYKLELMRDLIPVTNIYTLTDGSLHPRMADIDDLERLTEVYQTDWAILAGVDRADPLKINKIAGARTIVTLVAKGLPNSKNNPDMYIEDGTVKNYIYFLLHLAHVQSNELKHIKEVLKKAVDEFDGVDTLCAERWGMWDITEWCEENEIFFEPISPTYEKQRAAFTELYTLYKTGMFKTPEIRIAGSKESDILEEEAKMFDHNPFKKWYGSPEKAERYGIQDDSMFSLAWAIYGGRNLSPEDFRERKGGFVFGEMHENKHTMGKY